MLQKLLVKVVKELRKNNISYVIIGGQAVNMHGIIRATQDIDITLGIDTGQIDRLKKIISKLNLQYLKNEPDDFAKNFWIMPVYDLVSKVRIDFAFSFSPFEQSAINRASEALINNTKIMFCSIEDLIVFKVIAGREIDLFDVRNLILTNSSFDKEYVDKWLKLFEETTNENYNERLQKILTSLK